MTPQDVQDQMHALRVVKSSLGTRVRLYPSPGQAFEEYVKLNANGRVFYQRLESSVDCAALLPKFPNRLASHELPSGEHMPYSVERHNDTMVTVKDGDRACATYALSNGSWQKLNEKRL